MDEKETARLLGLVRTAIGTALVVAPRLSIRIWTGEAAGSPTARIATRGMGGRDLALGLGLLVALENGGPVSRWLEAGAVADASDAVATLAAARDLPRLRFLALLAGTAGAALLGMTLAAELDD